MKWLLAPVKTFVNAFAAGDWNGLDVSFYPVLRDALGPGTNRALDCLREAAGSRADFSATLYSGSAPGIHAMEITINGVNQAKRNTRSFELRRRGGEHRIGPPGQITLKPVPG